MPASNSSRANGLAGATTAMRSPGRSARGFSMWLGEPRHFGRDRLVLVAPEDGTQRGTGRRLLPRRRQEALLDASMPRQCVLDALQRQAPLLHRIDDRLERRHLLFGL